jgi:hypothetical protein
LEQLTGLVDFSNGPVVSAAHTDSDVKVTFTWGLAEVLHFDAVIRQNVVVVVCVAVCFVDFDFARADENATSGEDVMDINDTTFTNCVEESEIANGYRHVKPL